MHPIVPLVSSTHDPERTQVSRVAKLQGEDATKGSISYPARGIPIRVLGLAAGSALLLAACAQPAASAAPPTPMPAMPDSTVTAVTTPVATTSVTIQNFAFNPPAVVVPVGATVTWTNQDIEEHTVTARDKTFDSDVLGSGKSFSFTFTRAGTYEYLCSIHTSMAGKVVVVAR